MIRSGNILPNKLLVKPIPKKEKTTQSGIIIPNQLVKDVNISASVIAVGTGVPEDILINKGDTIIFNPHSVQRLILEDQEHGIIDYKDLLYIFTPESIA
jgi:co-chaperonin GroES (HSP10)